jgi:organic hydroperoxide reductase OsmC/OhrA
MTKNAAPVPTKVRTKEAPVRTLEHRYEARLEWTGAGTSGTEERGNYERSWTVLIEGKPALEGSANATFLGDAAKHDPEDLFLAAITSCHMLAYLALCAHAGVRVLAYEDGPSGTLQLRPGGGGAFAAVTLAPVVTIDAAAGSDDADRAERLHAAAHERCFIAGSCSVPIACLPEIRLARP